MSLPVSTSDKKTATSFRKIHEHESRLASVESLIQRTTEAMRDITTSIRDRDKHLDREISSLRDHVDTKIDALGDRFSRSREANPTLWLSLAAVLLTAAAVGAALVVLAISNATGPLDRRLDGTEKLQEQQIRLLDSIMSQGGGQWTREDHQRHETRLREDMRELRERLRLVEIKAGGA